MRLYVIRHGETIHNYNNRIQGPLLDESLSEGGRIQAKALGERFRGTRLDRVYASPLKRAHETAQAVAEATGAPLTLDKRLVEYSWGVYLGQKNEGDVNKTFKEFLKRWQGGDIHAKPPEGESPVETAERVMACVGDACANHGPGAHVAIVAHGRVNRVLLAMALHEDLTRQEEFPQSNTCVTILEGQPGAWKLVKLNDTAHLEGSYRSRESE